MLPWLSLVDVAYSVRRQVDLAVLLVWQLVFPGGTRGGWLASRRGLRILWSPPRNSPWTWTCDSNAFNKPNELTPHRAPHCLAQRAGPHRAGTRAAARWSSRCALGTSVIVGRRLSLCLGERGGGGGRPEVEVEIRLLHCRFWAVDALHIPYSVIVLCWVIG